MSLITPAVLRRPLDALRNVARLERVHAAEPERMLTDGGPSARDDDHLRDVPDGAGCTEIWEHLSERPAAESDD